jgi:AraC family transcriptional regulator
MRQSAITKAASHTLHGPDLLPSLANLLESARKEFDADREAARALLHRATSILRVEIDRRASKDETERGGGGLAGWQVRRLIVFVDARLEKPIRLRELSEICKLSTAYFCRAFKRTFNETPHSYVVRRRLAKAETLMLTSDLLLSDIAFRSGFTDQAHLCKLFRQQYGRSPAAWRREQTDIAKNKAKPDLLRKAVSEAANA